MPKQPRLTDKNFLLYILKKENLFLSKKLGQNFLISENTANQIIRALNISENDTVIEIGPGIGAISEQLNRQVAKLICIEYDKKLAQILPRHMPYPEKLTVIHQDAMKTDFKSLVAEQTAILPKNGELKLFSNLPYNIATSLIITILQETDINTKMIFMVQKELSERFLANINEKNYSATSVITQCLADIEITNNISRNNFFPVPTVESVLISVTKNNFLKKNNIYDTKKFCGFVKNCFAHRRKTLYNSLIANKGYNPQILTESISKYTSNIKIRAQALNREDFANLYKDACI